MRFLFGFESNFSFLFLERFAFFLFRFVYRIAMIYPVYREHTDLYVRILLKREFVIIKNSRPKSKTIIIHLRKQCVRASEMSNCTPCAFAQLYSTTTKTKQIYINFRSVLLDIPVCTGARARDNCLRLLHEMYITFCVIGYSKCFMEGGGEGDQNTYY